MRLSACCRVANRFKKLTCFALSLLAPEKNKFKYITIFSGFSHPNGLISRRRTNQFDLLLNVKRFI